MNNFNKKINITEYSLTPSQICVGTEKSHGFEKISFSFSPEWSGLFKTVTFYPPKKKPVSIEGVEAGVYYDVPAEVTARGGVGEYVVSGYAEGKKIYSVSGTFEVLFSRSELGVAPNAPTPSEIDQIRQYALDAKNAAEDAANAKKGEDGKDGYTPIKGVDYFDGKDGKDGTDGYTPQKGIDYFDGKDGKDGKDGESYILTEQDKADIAAIVLSEMPETSTYTGEVEVI